MALRSAIFCGLAVLAVLVDAQTTTAASKVEAAQCQGSPLATIITSPADAAALASACPIYAGTVNIDPQNSQDLTFSGLQSIGGDLFIKNLTNSINIYFPDLTTIVGNGNLWLTGAQPVYVSFPSLTITGNLYMLDWGSTTSIGGEHTISSLLSTGTLQVRNLTWILNTGLTTVNLPPSPSSAATVDIAGNNYLSSVTLAGSFSSVIDIHNNGYYKKADALSVDLSNLSASSLVTIKNNYGLSMSSLTSNLNNVVISNNTGLSSLDIGRISKLTGSLEVSSNPDLTQLAMPQLVSIQQNLSITDNPKLQYAGDFPSLKSVGNTMTLTGPIANMTYAHSIGLIGGAFKLQSSAAFPCNDLYTTLKNNKVLQGDWTCNSNGDSSGQANLLTASNTTTSNSSTSTTSSTASGAASSAASSATSSTGPPVSTTGSLSTGAIAGVAAGAVVAGILMTLAILLVWRHSRRRRAGLHNGSGEPRGLNDGSSEHDEKYDAYAYYSSHANIPGQRVELQAENERKELPATLDHRAPGQLAELQPDNERKELPATSDPRELEATSSKKAAPVSIYELPVKAG